MWQHSVVVKAIKKGVISRMKSHTKTRSKSLGTLFPSKKTKPRSPDMTGKLNILKDTLKEIINRHQEEDGEAFEVNMAGWFNNSGGKMYMTLELSPRFRSSVQRSEKDMTLEEFFSEVTEGQE
jgi:hypothetical protein